jgi:DNA repair exonuclease SbcCD ATPase subunit
MRSHFNANVPTRMPTTQIGRVLKELASEESEQDATGAEETVHPVIANGGSTGELDREHSELEEPEPVASQPLAPPSREAVAVEAPRAEAPPRPAAPEPAPSPAGQTREQSRLASGHERVAALRQRLAIAAQPSTAATDPKRTAATVREVVEELRARLEVSIQERSQLLETLEETRAALARAESELERERKTRVAAETRAEDRQRIADDAVAEAEALATERDQVLAELAEQRRLDDEQTALLVEIEASLTAREAERASSGRELAELRDDLDLKALEVADLESRLQAEAADRAKLESRLRETEAEVARLKEASVALEAIEAMVTRRG